MTVLARWAVWALVLAACGLLAMRYARDEHWALTVGTVAGIPALWWSAIWGCPA